MGIGPVIYPPQPITYEQYMAEDQVKRRYDILNGVRVFAVPPSIRHLRITQTFLRLFHDYARQRQLEILFSLFDVQISRQPFCTRQPDVMLVSKARMKMHQDGEPLSIAPELVVEILSSIDRELALENKLRDYQGIGVQECWVVRPDERAVTILNLTTTISDSGTTFREGETLHSTLLPDIQIDVMQVLQE